MGTFTDVSNWMALRWKAGLAFVYSVCVIVDMVVIPIWIGIHRVDMYELLIAINDFPYELQRQIIDTAFRQHTPFTLQGSGLFHLSFGLLLAGAAVTKDNLIDKIGSK